MPIADEMAKAIERENGIDNLFAKRKVKYAPEVIMAAWARWKNLLG